MKRKWINWKRVEADLKNKMIVIEEKLNQWILQHPEWRVKCSINHRRDVCPDPAAIICVFEILATSRPNRDTLGDGKTFIDIEEAIMVGKFMGSIQILEDMEIKYQAIEVPPKNIGELDYEITISDYTPYQGK